MRHTVRAFIIFLVTFTVAAAFFVVALLFYKPISDRIVSEQAAEMTRVATLLAQSAGRMTNTQTLQAEFEAWGRTLASMGNYRLSLINHNGDLLGDALLPANTVRPDADNHANRPEIRLAFSEGLGRSLRYSATSGGNYLYVAKRIDFQNAGQPHMVLRLGAPYTLMSGLKGDIFKKFGVAGLLAVLFAAVFSYLATKDLKDEMKRLNAMAGELAAGNLSRRLVRHPKNDLGSLGLSLNQIASRYSRLEKSYEADDVRLQGILANMEEGVLVTDAAGNIVNSNPAVARIFQLESSPEGLPGEFIRLPEITAAFERAAKGQATPSAIYRLPGAPDRLIEARISPLPHEGKATGVVAVFSDRGPVRVGQESDKPGL